MLPSIHVFLLFSFSLCSAFKYTNTSASSPSSSPTVTTKNGSYVGIYNAEYNQDFFLGIPYAQPPINDLRFQTPRPSNSTWEAPKNATKWPPFCVGYGVDSDGHEQSEDCLYLNIFRPSGLFPDSTAAKKSGNCTASCYSNSTNSTNRAGGGGGGGGNLLPVAVWIHGGGLFMGGTSDPRYNVSFLLNTAVLINKPFIAISIQYRLSAFGFLGGKEVLEEGVGNLGYRDQRLALEWVRENVGVFGGDRDMVTIWGESAGAQSVGAQLLAYNGRDDGLFRGAIMQSGGPAVSFFPLDLPSGYNSTAYQSTYDSLLSTTSCTTLSCLRTLPFPALNTAINSTIQENNGPLPFVPIIDNDFISTYPSTQLSFGNFVKVPILIGSNTDEGTTFGCSYNISTDPEFSSLLSTTRIPANSLAGNIIPYLYPNIEALGIPSPIAYPNLFSYDKNLSAELGSQFRRTTAYFGDLVVNAPRRRVNWAWSEWVTRSWSYRFDVRVNGKSPVLGATHFSEVGFVFGNFRGGGYAEGENPFDVGEDDQKKFFNLSSLMSKSWISFIVDGDPNGIQSDDSDGPGDNSTTAGNSTSTVTTKKGWTIESDGGIKGGWPAYNVSVGGGEGWNMVWTVNGTGSYVEWDTYRAEAMGWIGDNLRDVYGL